LFGHLITPLWECEKNQIPEIGFFLNPESSRLVPDFGSFSLRVIFKVVNDIQARNSGPLFSEKPEKKQDHHREQQTGGNRKIKTQVPLSNKNVAGKPAQRKFA